VFLVSILLTIFLTYPLAFRLGHVGRIELDDGRWSIWVTSWVARTLVADPIHLFDANIFYPHRNTLVYSEINLGSGLLGAPVYLLTRNPYATHNFVVLAGFVLSLLGMYYLARRLTGHRGAAAVAAVTFAFCPYVFGRTAHIQLMLMAGLPFSMLAFHRLVEHPGVLRGLVLALSIVLQTITCGYYGVFVVLMVACAVPFFAVTRGLWRSIQFWRALVVATSVSLACGMLVYLPYFLLREETGFTRTLDDARAYSANLRSYLVSNAHAHSWMLPWLKGWSDVLFPGFLATGFGLMGASLAWIRPRGLPRDVPVFYALMGLIAFWASFGPSAGLYTLLYNVVPAFSLMRAPARFGAIVVFALSTLTAFAVAWLAKGRPHGNWMAGLLTVTAIAELAIIPVDWRQAPPVPGPYRLLATLPRGPVVELPFFYMRHDFPRHSLYMLFSTYHWQPLVNGYSDYIPPDFREMVIVVSSFPARESFKRLEHIAPRYVVFHMNMFDRVTRPRVEGRIREFSPYLRLLMHEGDVWLYEITGWPE
jgi:hypothetical protein